MEFQEENPEDMGKLISVKTKVHTKKMKEHSMKR
jgi:hypothetical protein